MPVDATAAAFSEPLLQVEALSKVYASRRLLGPRTVVHALCGVELHAHAGEMLALIGPSGAGKSTLARCIAGLETVTSGRVRFRAQDISGLGRAQLRGLRREIQMVFQDSATALNPLFTARDIVAEPLLIQQRGGKAEMRARALDVMEQVGLARGLAERRPHELSGGQRQRLALARALALRPSLLVLDEPLTGLDVPAQIRILEILGELRQRYCFTCILISHDLRLVRSVADRVATMCEGRIVVPPSSAITRSMSFAAAEGTISARGVA